jgi:hypothetical protein
VWERNKEDKENQIFTTLRNRKHVSGVFPTKISGGSSGWSGEGRGVHRVLVGRPEGRRPLGRPRHRWEDNIKMDLEEVGGGGGDWMEWAQERDRWWVLVSTVTNFRVP